MSQPVHDSRLSRTDIYQLMSDSGLSPERTEVQAVLDSYTWGEDNCLDISCIPTATPNADILTKAMTDNLAIRDWRKFTHDLRRLYDDVLVTVHGGANADYIPTLATADSSKFAISVCTVDGQQWSCGDVKVDFSIQSCVKPLMYAVALEEVGPETMKRHIGIEPSGLSFNEVKLNSANRPHNPMINSGAIASGSLIRRDLDTASRFQYFTDKLRDLAGDEEIGFCQPTYLGEWETAWRNNSLMHYMTKAGVFPKDVAPSDVLDFYIQCCAIEVNTISAANIAATMAAGGVCPLNGVKCFSPVTVKAMLTLMYSCGMYDYSGEWGTKVGLPAKSGVAGLIYVVVPNVMGIAVFSPPLDKRGNSVRGVAFCERLMRLYKFGIFDNIVGAGRALRNPAVDLLKDRSPKKEIRESKEESDHDSVVNRFDTTTSTLDFDTEEDSNSVCSSGSLGRMHPSSITSVDAADNNCSSVATVGASASSLVKLEDEPGASECAQALRDAKVRLRADRATLYFVDRFRGELWTRATFASAPFRVPIGKGLVGACVATGRAVRVADAHEDPRFHNIGDRRTGYRTRSVLVVPLVHEEEVIGAVQLLNKYGNATFSETDEGRLQRICAQLVRSISGSGVGPQPAHRRQFRRAILLDQQDEGGEEIVELRSTFPRRDSFIMADINGIPGSPMQSVRSTKLKKTGHLRDKWLVLFRRAVRVVRGFRIMSQGRHTATFAQLEDMLRKSGISIDPQKHPLVAKIVECISPRMQPFQCSALFVPELTGNIVIKSMISPFAATSDPAALVIDNWGGFCSNIMDIFNTVSATFRGDGCENDDEATAVAERLMGAKHLWSDEDGDDVGRVVPTGIESSPDPDPALFGLSICTVDGQQFHYGDSGEKFPLQATLRPLLFALALQDVGVEEMAGWVGAEPTSVDPHMFDLISPNSGGGHGSGSQECEDGEQNKHPKPFNPFTDSGGLVVCSLMGNGHLPAEQRQFHDNGSQFQHVRDNLRRWAGGQKIGFSNPAFLALKERALRVKAVSHYIKGMGCYPDNIHPTENANVFFETSALESNCETLSVIAATLANIGVCPTTGEHCIPQRVVREVLSLMFSCGMNQFTGKWAFNVGIPASSGHSGALMLVIPNVMGMVIYSPLVNRYHVPTRGVKFCENLIKQYRFNLFDQLVYGDRDVKISQTVEDNDEGLVISTLLFFELCTAAGAGDVEVVQRCIDDGAAVNKADYDLRTPLHIACCDGQLAVVHLLVEAGASILQRDRWNCSPYRDARTNCHSEIVDYLEIQLRQQGLEHAMMLDRTSVDGHYHPTACKPVQLSHHTPLLRSRSGSRRSRLRSPDSATPHSQSGACNTVFFGTEQSSGGAMQ